MNERVEKISAFLTAVERLKLVNRDAYVSDLSRRENSAEHSWHLAVGLLSVARELDVDIDLPKALVMALIHDVCEIDAGDTPIYGPTRSDQHEAERRCIERLAGFGLKFGADELARPGSLAFAVLRVNEPVRLRAPEIFEWMVGRIDDCVRQGWLRDE